MKKLLFVLTVYTLFACTKNSDNKIDEEVKVIAQYDGTVFSPGGPASENFQLTLRSDMTYSMNTNIQRGPYGVKFLFKSSGPYVKNNTSITLSEKATIVTVETTSVGGRIESSPTDVSDLSKWFPVKFTGPSNNMTTGNGHSSGYSVTMYKAN